MALDDVAADLCGVTRGEIARYPELSLEGAQRCGIGDTNLVAVAPKMVYPAVAAAAIGVLENENLAARRSIGRSSKWDRGQQK